MQLDLELQRGLQIIKSLVALIGVVGATFFLAFAARIPFFLLVFGMVPAGVAAVWRIFRKTIKVEPSRIGMD